MLTYLSKTIMMMIIITIIIICVEKCAAYDFFSKHDNYFQDSLMNKKDIIYCIIYYIHTMADF